MSDVTTGTVGATHLEPFRRAGVLAASDIHLACTLARLAHVDDPAVVLAAALAARAPRHGDVGVDLTTVARHVEVEVGPDAAADLRWPDPAVWIEAVTGSALVAPHDDTVAPLVVHAGLVYLERYRTYERVVARELLRRAAIAVGGPRTDGSGADGSGVADSAVAAGLLTGEGADAQRAAVSSSLGNSLTVLLGGPGTGKTTTVAALVATIIDRHRRTDRSGELPVTLRLALAAPTGKAAARLGEAFREAAGMLPPEIAEPLLDIEASTIHRLLRPVPGSRTTFRHHARDPLPHDVVIVDESSMISLPLMARLLDAIRPDARLVVVGDPGQLTSVETGSVLGDIAGPLADPAPGGVEHISPLASCVTVLRHSRRFPPASPLAVLADAVRSGDDEAAFHVLTDPDAAGAPMGALNWIDHLADHPAAHAAVRSIVVPSSVEAAVAASAGDALGALGALQLVRVLCAHRVGSFGVEHWNDRIEAWLVGAGVDTIGWYPGRPVLITANDHRNHLYNGDLGVVVVVDGRPVVAFDDGAGVRSIGPSRLDAFETTHAMTIHKSQGSEFDHVVVLLPPAESRLATRELLYTAVTRARRMVTVVGDRQAISAAIANRTVRASRLRADLWPTRPTPRSPDAGR